MFKFRLSTFRAAAFALIALLPGQAMAYDWATAAKVTRIEASYVPGQVPFQIDTAIGNCPVGSWLYWQPQGADSISKAQNIQAILSVLMTAKSTGQPITVYGNNAGCNAVFLYLG